MGTAFGMALGIALAIGVGIALVAGALAAPPQPCAAAARGGAPTPDAGTHGIEATGEG